MLKMRAALDIRPCDIGEEELYRVYRSEIDPRLDRWEELMEEHGQLTMEAVGLVIQVNGQKLVEMVKDCFYLALEEAYMGDSDEGVYMGDSDG